MRRPAPAAARRARARGRSGLPAWRQAPRTGRPRRGRAGAAPEPARGWPPPALRGGPAARGRAPRPAGPRRAGRVQRRILHEDGPLQLSEAARRLEAELLVERAPEGLVGGERLGLAAGAVEREHELGPQPLAQRLVSAEDLELAHQVAVAPEG